MAVNLRNGWTAAHLVPHQGLHDASLGSRAVPPAVQAASSNLGQPKPTDYLSQLSALLGLGGASGAGGSAAYNRKPDNEMFGAGSFGGAATATAKPAAPKATDAMQAHITDLQQHRDMLSHAMFGQQMSPMSTAMTPMGVWNWGNPAVTTPAPPTQPLQHWGGI